MLARYADARTDLHLLFCDEAWWGLRTEVGRVWARGPRPVLRVSGTKSWTPVMAAAEPATGKSVAIIAGRFDHRWFGHFLREVSREYEGERVVLVVDRAGWHVSGKLEVPDNMILWFLPPHSPELNPIFAGVGVVALPPHSRQALHPTRRPARHPLERTQGAYGQP